MKHQRRRLGIISILLLLGGMVCQHPTASAYLAMARAAQEHWEWNRAVTWYQAAADLAPTDPAPLLGIAQIRLWQGHNALATTAITQAEQRAPDAADVWLLAGDIAHAKHDDAAARTAWQRTIPLAPNTQTASQAADHLATQALDTGQPAIVLSIKNQAHNHSSSLMFDAALAYLHLGQPTQAQAQFASLSNLPPSMQTYRAIAAQWRGTASDEAALGYADLAQGFSALALAPLQIAVGMDPTYGEGHAYLAWALWATGDIPHARGQLSLAQLYAPDAPDTVGLAALNTAQAGHVPLALQSIAQWQTRHTPSAALWAIQAQLAAQSDNLAAEEDAHWQLATSASAADRLSNQIALATFYLRTRLGRDDGRAAWAFAQMNVAAPQNAIAADLAAQWDWQNGHPDDALTLLYHAIALNPGDPAMHRHLATYAAALGDTTTATLETSRAAELD